MLHIPKSSPLQQPASQSTITTTSSTLLLNNNSNSNNNRQCSSLPNKARPVVHNTMINYNHTHHNGNMALKSNNSSNDCHVEFDGPPKSTPSGSLSTTNTITQQQQETLKPPQNNLSTPESDNGATTTVSTKVLTIDCLPKRLLDMEYAVRGAIVSRAEAMKRELKVHPEKFSKFSEIIPANIGNPHAVGQKPITFNRQVLACLINPALLDEDDTPSIYSGRSRKLTSCSFDSTDPFTPPSTCDADEILSQSSTCDLPSFPFLDDVRNRAQRYLHAFPSFGSYSHSKGIQVFRHDIAEWFERRDGFKCDPESIFLTDGASSAIRMILELLVSDPTDGVLIPVPQYPLYSATITRMNGTAVKYYLDEENGWQLTSTELIRAITEARAKGINCKAIAIINPGNPTGSLLRPEEMIDVVRFCEKERLVILADEVYQQNVYCEDAEFVPFRKIVKMMKSKVELVSFHSSSKGLGGECGVRGGLMQMENIHTEVMAILYKLSCVALCANTFGQAMMALLLNPPQPGQPSYELYLAETRCVFNALKRKALYATQKFNEMDSVVCQPIEGSMYCFPSIHLPPKAIAAAKEKGMEPDMLYCMEMLEETGVVCVPGSGFSQKPGTYHFRVTILPSEDKFATMLHSMHKFHNRFLRKYGAVVSENPSPTLPPPLLVPDTDATTVVMMNGSSSSVLLPSAAEAAAVASVIKSPPL